MAIGLPDYRSLDKKPVKPTIAQLIEKTWVNNKSKQKGVWSKAAALGK